MTHRRAILRQGKLELSEPLELPEGTEVRLTVEPIEALPLGSASPLGLTEDPLADLESWAAEGPTDLAAEHDHYASGAPKRR
jgi:hypothetical protein